MNLRDLINHPSDSFDNVFNRYRQPSQPSEEVHYDSRAGGLLALSGIPAETLRRQGVEAERRQQEFLEKRLTILRAEDSTINDARNEELRDYVSLKGLTATDLLGELKRTSKLFEEYQADVATIPKPAPGDERATMARDEVGKAVSRSWAIRDLFGSPRANDKNFDGMPIPGEPVWEKPTGETIVGTPKDPRAFAAEGWLPIRIAPDFTARVRVLQRLLNNCYRAGDVPKEVEAAKDALIDLRIAYSDLIESARPLIRKANIAPSRFAPDIEKFRAAKAKVENELRDQTLRLQLIGIDPRVVGHEEVR
jgi:hypothetical protein